MQDEYENIKFWDECGFWPEGLTIVTRIGNINIVETKPVKKINSTSTENENN
jgi:hypothetical protein